MDILWRYVIAYSDYYWVEYKMSLTSIIIRRPSGHIINYSLTHSPTQSINQSIDGSRDTLRTLNFTLFYDLRKCLADLCAYLSEIHCLLINTFLLIRYWCKLPRYICLIQHCWTKKISGIFIIHIISIHFSFRAEADFKCYL